jgi:glucose/arabinose dehydrogenase
MYKMTNWVFFMKKSYNNYSREIEALSGDTFYSIAKRLKVNLNGLIKANPHIINPNFLQPGQMILLPDKYTDEPNRHYFQDQKLNQNGNHHNSPNNMDLDPGYEMELVTSGFNFPTSITFDDQGNIYVGESGYSYGPAKVEGGGKIKKIDNEGNVTIIASGFRGPLTGVTWHRGYFYVAVGSNPGKIYRVDIDGNREILIDDLPTGGDHYTSNIIFDQNDNMYFGTGTFTNSAIVGMDNFMMGWLASHPEWHDIPPRDYILLGKNYRSLDPFNMEDPEFAFTGAFHPFGKTSSMHELVKGQLKANGVLYRARLDGTNLEQYANGLRNPFAINISPCGILYCIDQGFDARGSRPIANAPDPMYQIQPGGWYGWPDYVAGIPVVDPRFKPENGPSPEFVLADHPPVAERIVTTFEPHASACKFHFSNNPYFGYLGDAFVALFGALTPMTGTVTDHPGHRVVRVNMDTGEYYDFLTSHHGHNLENGGERNEDGGHAAIRPIDVQFNPIGDSLYVLDFGRIDVNKAEMTPYAESGALWRIKKRK